MKTQDPDPESDNSGKIGWALLWVLGVPLPILLLVYLLKGCH